MRNWMIMLVVGTMVILPLVALAGCGNDHKEQAKYEIGDPDMPPPPPDGDDQPDVEGID